MILLTQDSGKILGPISKLLGVLMNGIFLLLDAIGIPNTGLSIILFTFASYDQAAEVFKTFRKDES